ncbi:MAG: cation diffusion facilitator family transporter [Oscillospiraceae bacterium]
MIKLLLKWFVKDYENVDDKDVRTRYGVLGGILGIICNLFLFAVKLFSGIFMNSIAIISDSVNNLSDTGSSIVTLVGSKLSGMRPDKEHPFGHGRIEYISSLIVSFVIMLVGFELMKSSYGKIINPEPVAFSLPIIILLSLSVLVKVWMYSYNKYLGKQINSSILIATSKDSINDVFSTSAVIVTTIIGRFVNFPLLDGIVGIVVSIMVMYSGFGIAREVIDVLLGKSPEKETVDELVGIIKSGEGIVGVHDLIVHDYGPGRVLASVHVEVPDDVDIVLAHETIDSLERLVYDKMQIELVIHLDPISVNDERVKHFRELTAEVIREINPEFSFHDFRMTDGDENINLIFDLAVPVEVNPQKRTEAVALIKEKLREHDSRCNTVICVDDLY